MGTIYYDEEQQIAAKQFDISDVEGATKISPVRELISSAGAISDQVAEAARVAGEILEALIGPQEEGDCADCAKDMPPRGALGELARHQQETLGHIASLRRAVELIGNMVR